MLHIKCRPMCLAGGRVLPPVLSAYEGPSTVRKHSVRIAQFPAAHRSRCVTIPLRGKSRDVAGHTSRQRQDGADKPGLSTPDLSLHCHTGVSSYASSRSHLSPEGLVKSLKTYVC